MRFTRTLTSVAVAAASVVALSGCVAGEGSAALADADAGGEWSSNTLNIDFATYNPLSLVIKEQGWLEDKLDGVTVTWLQSAGSNKANAALRAGAIDVGSTAGSAALLARSNGSPIQVIDLYSQPGGDRGAGGFTYRVRRRPAGEVDSRYKGNRPLLLPASDAG